MPAKGYKDNDRGWKKLKADLRKLGSRGMYTSVGIQGSAAMAAKKTGATNVEVATAHEYGMPRKKPPLPERSFLRSTFDKNQAKYQKELDKAAKTMLSPNGRFLVHGELMLLGEDYRADIVERINSGISPALSEVTIDRKKGEETPLIDTGQLRNSISSIVTDGKKATA